MLWKYGARSLVSSLATLVSSTKDGYIYKIDQDDASLVNHENIVQKITDPIIIGKTFFPRNRVQHKRFKKLETLHVIIVILFRFQIIAIGYVLRTFLFCL